MEKKNCKCTGPWDCQCEEVTDRFYGGDGTKEPQEDKTAPLKAEGIETLADILWGEWALKDNGFVWLTRDLFLLSLQDKRLIDFHAAQAKAQAEATIKELREELARWESGERNTEQ